ncbi:MAG TPA: hypothetical protein PLB25_14290 [Rhodoferax sp.]|jgi:hypothetical protein|uniref:hypothetical protein n=1 Tax=Hydrogenophaga sp. MI9 TaxID=3453719 RepID=UPI002B7FC287|nr:hypothetical protein [Rhodoferax sp.]
MRLKKSLSNLSHQVATLLLAGAVAAPSWAERIRFVSVIAPTAEAKLVFADGSNRTLSLVQREGMTSGAGPLASAIMQEWGMHDIVPAQGGADGAGYLVFTLANGDKAYLKYQWHAIQVVQDGKARNLFDGHWGVVGSTGKLVGLQGIGTLYITPVSATGRQWTFEGELVLNQAITGEKTQP